MTVQIKDTIRAMVAAFLETYSKRGISHISYEHDLSLVSVHYTDGVVMESTEYDRSPFWDRINDIEVVLDQNDVESFDSNTLPESEATP